MSDYNEPTDAEIAAYWPINFPLKRKWRNAIQHVKRYQWNGGFDEVTHAVTDGSGDDGNERVIGSFEVYVPNAATGLTSPSATGTSIQIRFYATLSTDANATSANATLGIRHELSPGLFVFDTAAALGVVGTSGSDTGEFTRTIGGNIAAGSLILIEVLSTVTVSGATGVATLTADIRNEDPCVIFTSIS